MRSQSKSLIIICTVLISSILIGQVLLKTSPYYHNIYGERDGDLAFFDIDSNVYSNYAAMTFVSQNDYGITEYVICYDDSRVWFASQNQINNGIYYLMDSLNKCSVDTSVLSVEETLKIIEDSLKNVSCNIAIIFVTGSFPSEIYDGEGSLIFDWLSAGGVMYWVNGPIGKYVSSVGDNELEEMQNYDQLFFGKENVIRDDDRPVFDRDPGHMGLAEIMCMLFNECTYGIDNSLLNDSLDFGFENDSYKSVTLTKYHKGDGMIVVFGGGMNVNNALYISQVIASGIDHSSVMIDFDTGREKSVSGWLDISETGISTLFVYVGSIQGIFARTFSL